MCARYTVFTEDEIIEMRSIIEEVSRKFGDGTVCTGDVYPTNIAPILTLENSCLSPQPISWGFPKWDGKGVVINARSESALLKRMFSQPLQTRRCVIPSTGFYEWASESSVDPQISLFSDHTTPAKGGSKVKLLFRHPDEPMLYMAGMINTFTGKDGNAMDAFVILTTAANTSMSAFHDRMPVLLTANEREDWISSEVFMREVITRESAALVWKMAG